MKTLLLLILFILICLIPLIGAEPLYKWIDDDGHEQYSNDPPRGYEDGTVHVEIIDGASELSFKGEFVEQKTQTKTMRFLTDEEWIEHFDRYDALPPRLPDDTKDALIRLKRIIADEDVYVSRIKKRLSHHNEQYARRKAEFDQERDEHEKRGFNMTFWRPKTVVESEEEHEYQKKKYSEEMSYHGLILAWAKQKEIQYRIKLQEQERQQEKANNKDIQTK
jgi:hypothetical protein